MCLDTKPYTKELAPMVAGAKYQHKYGKKVLDWLEANAKYFAYKPVTDSAYVEPPCIVESDPPEYIIPIIPVVYHQENFDTKRLPYTRRLWVPPQCLWQHWSPISLKLLFNIDCFKVEYSLINMDPQTPENTGHKPLRDNDTPQSKPNPQQKSEGEGALSKSKINYHYYNELPVFFVNGMPEGLLRKKPGRSCH